MNQSWDENLKRTSQVLEKENNYQNAVKAGAQSNRAQSLSEILQRLNALSDDEWDQRVESAIQSAEREPEKHAFLLAGRKHPLADTFEKVFDSADLVASSNAFSVIKASQDVIIMGALSIKRYDILERMNVSVQLARQRFDEKTLFCIDTVASSAKEKST